MKAMWDREGAGITDYEPVSARAGRPVPAWANPKTGLVRAQQPTEKENVSVNRGATDPDKKFAPVRRAAPATAAAKAGVQRPTTPKSSAKPGVVPAAATTLLSSQRSQRSQTSCSTSCSAASG